MNVAVIQQAFKPKDEQSTFNDLPAAGSTIPLSSSEMLNQLKPLNDLSVPGRTGVNYRAEQLDTSLRDATGGKIDMARLSIAKTYMAPGQEKDSQKNQENNEPKANRRDIVLPEELKAAIATANENRLADTIPTAEALKIANSISNGNKQAINNNHQIALSIPNDLGVKMIEQIVESQRESLVHGNRHQPNSTHNKTWQESETFSSVLDSVRANGKKLNREGLSIAV
jgi:hypothetical protein